MFANDATTPFAVTVVEDDPSVLDLLVRAADLWNFRCQIAAGAEQAVRLLEHHPTPIVVTDVHLRSEKDGIWLVQEVRRRWPKVAVIVITAANDGEAAIECLNAGAARYLRKPVRLEEFRDSLEKAYRDYLVQREHEHYHQHLEVTVHRQTRQIRRQFLSTVDSLVRTLEARDPYTCGHSRRVRRYALRLASALGLEEQQKQHLSLAAKLHDIGKFGVPEAVLHKPGRLTEEELAVLRKHPVISERILAPVIRNREILSAVRGHHERYDGQGYPDALAGEQIPVLARVLAVADCFDAMTTCRSYRNALPLGQALDRLNDGAGAQFDPDIVRTFTDVVAPALCAGKN
jgi:putative two-component system response regulator